GKGCESNEQSVLGISPAAVLASASSYRWVGDLVRETHDLVSGEEDHLLLGGSAESRAEYGVVLDRSGANRQRHYEAEHVADVAHRAWPVSRRREVGQIRQHARMVDRG